MKLTFCMILIGGSLLLLLLNVDAGTTPARRQDENASNEIERIVQGNNFGLLSILWSIFKIILHTVKSIHCLTEWALGIQTAAEKFTVDIQQCGGNVSSDLQALIDANLAVIGTCKEIVELQQTVCKSFSDVPLSGLMLEELMADGESEVERSNAICYIKSAILFARLAGEVSQAVQLATQIPTTGADASKCVTTAVDDLTAYFTESQSIIEQCIDSNK